MGDRAPQLPRWGLVLFAVPQIFTGIWAMADPGHWFANFPGLDPRLVAAEPPFNSHLANDAGAGFLATGLALLLAALWMERRVILMALITYTAFAVPHFLFHLLNPSQALTTTENVANVTSLGVSVVGPLIMGWLALRGSSNRTAAEAPEPATPQEA